MARIIIVDDDDVFCDAASHTLTGAGHIVSSARDGESAIVIIADSQPDLLILDYNLPGISGLEILRRTRQDPASEDMPIMMVTREDGRLMKARADYDGADDYLVKPCNPAELVSHVEALLVGQTITKRVHWSPLKHR